VRLGAKSNLSEDTIREFENGRRIPGPGSLTRIRQALEAAGVVFTSGAPSLTNLAEGEAGVIGFNEM
jgi:transcriptional regulator with XRE-family HTH domain